MYSSLNPVLHWHGFKQMSECCCQPLCPVSASQSAYSSVSLYAFYVKVCLSNHLFFCSGIVCVCVCPSMCPSDRLNAYFCNIVCYSIGWYVFFPFVRQSDRPSVKILSRSNNIISRRNKLKNKTCMSLPGFRKQPLLIKQNFIF